MSDGFVLRGDICFSVSKDEVKTIEDGYLVCEDGVCRGAYRDLPGAYSRLPLEDHRGAMILPGLVDMHVHAPQYAYWGLGMDRELIDWLSHHAFPEEEKYRDTAYAEKAYRAFTEDVRRGPNTRALVYATCHVPATLLLMDMLEGSGLATCVGKVNMDRHSPPGLQEEGAEASLRDTEEWLRVIREEKSYTNTAPILTPRFIPSCSDSLMRGLGEIRRKYGLPIQSHMSENQDEVAWVKELCPGTASYAEAYQTLGTFDGEKPAVMAHCIWVDAQEISRMKEQGVSVAHCPQSNMNLSSGLAPIRRFLDEGVAVGLGSDVAGGSQTSIFRAMSDAIQASKMYWRLADPSCAPLSLEEAFYLGTLGGGAFWGKAGSFLEGYEFDALVMDDSANVEANPLTIGERLARVVYRPDRCKMLKKYVRGKRIL